MTGESRAIRKLIEKFSDASLKIEEHNSATMVTVGKERARDVLLFLKSDPECIFDMLTDQFGVDHSSEKPRFEIIYLLNSLGNKERLTVKVRLAEGENFPTVCDIWKAAEWFEREIRTCAVSCSMTTLRDIPCERISRQRVTGLNSRSRCVWTERTSSGRNPLYDHQHGSTAPGNARCAPHGPGA
jgi:NADH-quinone oxidoreductase subunit C